MSNWKLGYREDAGDTVSLFFQLTKYGTVDDLSGVGVVDLKKHSTGWEVTGYDSYF